MESKIELRKSVRATFESRSRADLRKASAEICRLVTGLPEWASAKSVCLFASQSLEPFVDPLFDTAREEGKEVCYPRVRGRELELVETSGHHELVITRWNLREPSGERLRQTARVDLILVPGLAFDERGFRLGRGGGYYDRLLSGLKETVTVGVCFAFQRLSDIPLESHDRAVRIMVTENGVNRPPVT